MKEEIVRVRMLLGMIDESYVPDHDIENALKRFTPDAAAHYIRLTLAGPDGEHAAQSHFR